MSKRAGSASLVAALALFLVLNRAAYKGYFQDDDLDTMGWARTLPPSVLLSYLVSPQLPASNFRPVGAFYYHALETSFGLDFPKYIAALDALHWLNVWLLWLLARKLGMGWPAASAGAFFFGFHAALFDAWWKPMYVFDVLCATFSLLALLLYANDRWILSLISFWLAFKSKELAVMLPAVLVCYELWLGQKRWKRLLPFFAVSLLFGVQGVMQGVEAHRGTPYAMHLGAGAQASTIAFYSSQLFLLPYAGLLLVALPFVIRDRKLWFGVAAMCLMLLPLLLLPGRVAAVYWYVPLTGAAIALAGIADGRYRLAVALLLAIWLPWDFIHFRELRRLNERREQQNHAYVAAIETFARANPDERHFVFDTLPEEFHNWGVSGALKCIYRTQEIGTEHIDHPGAQERIRTGNAAWLHWNGVAGRLDIVRLPRTQPTLPYLTMDAGTPLLQLTEGWYWLEEGYRWTKPVAEAVLLRPEGASRFEVAACVTAGQIRDFRKVQLRVLAGKQFLGEHEFTAPGCRTLEWTLPTGPAGTVKIEFDTTPPYHPPNDSRVLGVTMKAFGFLSK